MHTGMMSFLLDVKLIYFTDLIKQQLISDKIVKSTNIQISFDLLGEIVKFNRYNLNILNKTCMQLGYFNQINVLIQRNIIDSNVFLRSIIITYEKIIYQKEMEVILLELLVFNF